MACTMEVQECIRESTTASGYPGRAGDEAIDQEGNVIGGIVFRKLLQHELAAMYHSMIKFLSLDDRITLCWRGRMVKWQRPCT